MSKFTHGLIHGVLVLGHVANISLYACANHCGSIGAIPVLPPQAHIAIAAALAVSQAYVALRNHGAGNAKSGQ